MLKKTAERNTGPQKVAFWILFILGREDQYISKIKLLELLKKYNYHCAEEITDQVVSESLRKLKDGGLILAARGKGKGYKLSKSKGEISIFSVLASFFPMDFKSSIERCPAYYLEEPCPIEDICRLKQVWLHVRNILIKETKKFTLEEFLK